MPEFTLGQQLRIATVTDRVAKYKIDTHVKDRGELPSRGVFLKSIVDDDDPKKDKLHRVCRVGDLEMYQDDRDAALREGTPYWRDVSIVKLYDSLSEAQVASEFIKERVNALVEEYIEYLNNFRSVPGEELEYPAVDVGVLGPKISEYSDKVEERKAKEKELEEIEEHCDEVDSEYDEISANIQEAEAVLDALKSSKSALSTALSAMLSKYTASSSISAEISSTLSVWDNVRGDAAGNVQTSMDNLLEETTGSLYDAYHTVFQPSITDFDGSISSLESSLTKIEEEITAQENRISEYEGELDAVKDEKAQCAKEKVSAAAELEAIEQQEDSLLDEVQGLCPDFEPEED